jgi:hypothetical protein
MKKFIQMAVLQLVLGLVFVGGAKGVAVCGETFYSLAAPDETLCNCTNSPMEAYGTPSNYLGVQYCCGWAGNGGCLSTSDAADSRYELCMQIPHTGGNTAQYDQCKICREKEEVWTALGCISSKPEDIVRIVEIAGLGLAGSVVLIMIIVGAFKLSVSQGDPNKTKEAKDTITSAIIGLLFVIFSVTILQFIGVSVLHIPGFGE